MTLSPLAVCLVRRLSLREASFLPGPPVFPFSTHTAPSRCSFQITKVKCCHVRKLYHMCASVVQTRAWCRGRASASWVCICLPLPCPCCQGSRTHPTQREAFGCRVCSMPPHPTQNETQFLPGRAMTWPPHPHPFYPPPCCSQGFHVPPTQGLYTCTSFCLEPSSLGGYLQVSWPHLIFVSTPVSSY